MKPKNPQPAPPEKQTALNLTAAAEFDLEAAGEGAGALPRFRMVAYTGGAMRVAGWRHPVVLDLAGLSIPSQSRPIRFGHDPAAGVGHTDSIGVEAGQLVATGVVSRDTAAAREVVASSRNGFPWQASVGTSVEAFELVRENQQVTVNGRQFAGPLNVVRKATLGEISFVDLGADGATSASVAARADIQGGDTTVEENEPAAPAVDTTQACDAAVAGTQVDLASERQRVTGVIAACNGRHSDIQSRAIAEGWSVEQTKAAILDAVRIERPKATAVHVPDNTVTAAVLEAACLLTANLPDLEEAYQPQTLELAARRFRGGIGLQELLLEAAWANGYTGRNFRDSRSVLRYAFGRSIEAALCLASPDTEFGAISMEKLTAGITAFERPEHLARCVASLRRHYPTLPVIVADCGRQRAELPDDVELLNLPWDAGLSAARNGLARACRTPYLLISEDDFVFSSTARLERLVDLLQHDPSLALAGGSILDGPLLRPGAFDFAVSDGLLRATPAVRRLEKTANGTEFRRCDKIANYFVARTDVLRRHPWPDELKVGEHAAWFWLLHQAGVQVAHVPGVAIEHERGGRPAHYVEHRQRAETLRDEWFAARGLRYHQQKYALRRDTINGIATRRSTLGGDARRALTEVRGRRAAAAEQYRRWPWSKLQVDYEQLRKAVNLFDVSRG